MKRAFAIIGASMSMALHPVEIIIGEPVTERVHEPFSVDFDADGVLYGVEFTKANRVFMLAGGKLSFIAGRLRMSSAKTPDEDALDGEASNALFNGMHDIAIAGRIVYIADTFNNRIRTLDLASKTVRTLTGGSRAGYAGDGNSAENALFNQPICAVLSPDRSMLAVADIGNGRARIIDTASRIIRTAAGTGRKGTVIEGTNAVDSPMSGVRALALAADGTLYIALREGNSLVAVRDGIVSVAVNVSGKAGYSGDGGPGRDAMLKGPKYLAMDPKGRVLIADTENHAIRRYDPSSGVIDRIAGTPTKYGNTIGTTLLDTKLKRPHGVRIGPDNLIYVVDTENDRILRARYE
ncbi:MAG: hypothetical protein AABZ39_16360 [Spirochaetota bacterium]